MTREDAQRKVRALRNTAADGSGATDAERATAARLADGLEARFGMKEPATSFTASDYAAAGDAFGAIFGSSFTVDVAAAMSDMAREFAEKGHLKPRTRDEILRDFVNQTRDERLEEKRRRFRDILNGKA